MLRIVLIAFLLCSPSLAMATSGSTSTNRAPNHTIRSKAQSPAQRLNQNQVRNTNRLGDEDQDQIQTQDRDQIQTQDKTQTKTKLLNKTGTK